jgi:uncharacterized protein (DUF1015 family)
VFLTYRDDADVAKVIEQISDLEIAWTVETPDEVSHSFIVIDDPAHIEAIAAVFSNVPALYIADGHHRSAAAARVASLRKRKGSSNRFLAGIFPDSQLQTLSYNRLVTDLYGHTRDRFLSMVGENFTVTKSSSSAPSKRGEITMYLGSQWYLIEPKAESIPEDIVGQLDVSLLQNLILAPILGIENPRINRRIKFVGGIRGDKFLSDAVGSKKAAIAFNLFPTGIDQLLAVADAGELMPPKSTWFEPKLRGGVLIHKIQE